MSRIVVCTDCKRRRPHKALGKCATCYRNLWRLKEGWVPVMQPGCTAPGCMTKVMCDGLEVCVKHLPVQLGITYRQLDSWTRSGYLRPSRGGGSGHTRAWPSAELEIARRMGRLTAAGLPAEWAARFAREQWPAGELAEGINIEVVS